MKKSAAVILPAFMLFFYACSDNKGASESTVTAQETTVMDQPQSLTDTPAQENPLMEQIESAPSTPPATNTAIPVTPNGSQALNPPHGEPGHDCAIAVGAPLNSPKSTPAPVNQSIQMSPQPVTPAQTTPVSTTPAPTTTPIMAVPPAGGSGGSGKVNPPHGEPGHDCAKAVGAPL